jgi:putative transposase
MALARKSIKQRFHPSAQLLSLMECFRQMTNDCIRAGLQFEKDNNQTPSMKKLSLMLYTELRRRYGGYSQYGLCAISKAAGILSARKKSIRRGFRTKSPYVSRRVLVSCYGFKVVDGCLRVHLDTETFESIPLNAHTKAILSDSTLKIRSFTLTEESVSLCVSKEVREMGAGEVRGAVGVDRNLRNLAVGDARQLVTFYDMTEVVRIGENTRDVVSSFKRNDVRIRRQIASKYGSEGAPGRSSCLTLCRRRWSKMPRLAGRSSSSRILLAYESSTAKGTGGGDRSGRG